MGDIQSQAKLFYDGPAGSFQLVRVKSSDFDDERDGEVVTAIGVNGGAGVRFKEGGGEIKFEVYGEQGNPEIDYLDHKDRKLFFAITRQKVGGQRHQFRGVFVKKYSEKSDSEGNHMLSVTLGYTGVKKLPSI